MEGLGVTLVGFDTDIAEASQPLLALLLGGTDTRYMHFEAPTFTVAGNNVGLELLDRWNDEREKDDPGVLSCRQQLHGGQVRTETRDDAAGQPTGALLGRGSFGCWCQYRK